MRYITLILCLATLGVVGQSKKVTETVPVSGQTALDLKFDFADNIVINTWDKKEVMVEVSVNINDGEDNDIFTLKSQKLGATIIIAMDKDMWKKVDRKNNNCSWTTELNYTVYAPKDLIISASTISGDYQVKYDGRKLYLKTISGEIDMTIPQKLGLDFKAKTISGEVYSDIEIQYPNGKEGLRQIVGQNIKGRIGTGGVESELETISGNIYLRKG